ncbi:hypothetical protein [Streptomyces sp. SYSU K21746]
MAVGEIRILNTTTLLQFSRRLRAAGGPRLQQNFARRIRRAAEPLKDDLERTMRTLNIRSDGGRSRGGPSPTTRPLRATIASAIRISVRTGAQPGARVWIDRSALPRDLRGMPKAMNDTRWRHPVYGNRRRWSTQYASPAWWDATVRKHEPRMRAEVARITDDVRRSLGG